MIDVAVISAMPGIDRKALAPKNETQEKHSCWNLVH